MRTKKVGTTGRFGSRYGVGIRKRIVKVEDKQKNLGACPHCEFERIKRQAAGLYSCTKCCAKFTGGAYQVETLSGKAIKKMVIQKSFVIDTLEDIKVKESSFADIEKEVEKVLEEPIPVAQDVTEKIESEEKEK